LARRNIPFLARIVTVADAFDAMTSKRAYRSAMAPNEAIAELFRNRKRQFDPEVLDAFVEAMEADKEKKDYGEPSAVPHRTFWLPGV
jgi:HD-GYP domain-containing protein (c-di-GMP phosphodiesterase class II)